MKTVYFDLETGGVNNEPNIQLAAVAIDENWEECGSFEQKIQFNPAECQPEALKINGYTEQAWKDAVAPSETVRRFSAFLKQHSTVEMMSKRTGEPYMVARLAGYNALTFDLPRLRGMYGTSFFPCSYHVRDVLHRAMFYFDENQPFNGEKPKDLKLTTLCEWFGIDVTGAHDALTDVRLTYKLHREMSAK